MIWFIDFIELIKTKLVNKFKILHSPNFYRNMMIISLFFICFILLLPIIWAGFYNHMSGDDWYNARITHTHILNGTLSLKTLLTDAFAEMINMYHTWSFTYTSNFIDCFTPAVFNEQYTWLHTVILLGWTVCGMFLFFAKIARRWLGNNRVYSCVIALLLINVMVQYMPSAFDAFFWWSGSMSYTLGFVISIIDIAFLFKIYFEPQEVKKWQWIIYGISLFLIVGTNYAPMLVLFSCMFLMLIDIIIYKRIKRSQRIAYYCLFGIYIICIIFGISAPGNRVRSEVLEEMGSYGLSPVSSILHAYKAGADMLIERMNVCYILFLIAICVLILPKLISKRRMFKSPLFVVFTLYSIYITSFIPTFFAFASSGESRVANIQYWYSIIFLTGSVIYCLGWYLGKKEIDKESLILTKYKKEIIAILVMLGMATIVFGEPQATSRVAMRDILTGDLQKFDAEVDIREQVYKDSRGKDVVVESLTNIPQLFYGYTDLQEEHFWINTNVRDYYQLERLRIKTDVR